MEISREEYLALTRRVEELEKRQNLPKSGYDRGWADWVNELPINILRLKSTENDELSVEYEKSACDAWLAFSKLAKLVHTRSWSYKRTYSTHWGWNWRSEGDNVVPKRYHELTDEQKAISLEMLNELIPIYNKYFKMTHPGLWVSHTSGERCYVDAEE